MPCVILFFLCASVGLPRTRIHGAAFADVPQVRLQGDPFCKQWTTGLPLDCYYKILGIPFRASQEEIKKAFRALALRWHPDRNPGDPRAAEHFREVLEAYESLVEESERRTRRELRRSEKAARDSWGVGFEGAPEEGVFSILDEILQETFGVDFARRKSRRGTDLRFDVQIPRSHAACGVQEDIAFQRLMYCRRCSGEKSSPAVSRCDLCMGNGQLEEHCNLRIWIPPGSENGTRLRIVGQGDHPAPGIPPGDLVVCVHLVDGM